MALRKNFHNEKFAKKTEDIFSKTATQKYREMSLMWVWKQHTSGDTECVLEF